MAPFCLPARGFTTQQELAPLSRGRREHAWWRRGEAAQAPRAGADRRQRSQRSRTGRRRTPWSPAAPARYWRGSPAAGSGLSLRGPRARGAWGARPNRVDALGKARERGGARPLRRERPRLPLRLLRGRIEAREAVHAWQVPGPAAALVPARARDHAPGRVGVGGPPGRGGRSGVRADRAN
jgi:hypothetical protein